ncbi:MAG: hypothetical protein QNI84_07285 [Henriciella sp.]|nr:hypothetical protein [Henriciella sp.]
MTQTATTNNFVIVFGGDDLDLPNLVDAIKEFGDWCRVTETAYFIVSTHETKCIMETLHRFCGPSSDLAIFSVDKPWSSYIDLISEDLIETKIGKMSDYVPIDFTHRG